MWWTLFALAAAPAVVVESDGTVVATVVLDASEAEVRALLADSVAAARLSADVLEATASTHGRCEQMEISTRGFLRPLTVVTLRCPTADGWRETLLRSDDFTRYVTEWRISTVVGGTRVEHRVNVGVDLPVPEAAVRQGLLDAVVAKVDALRTRLAR